MRRPASSGNVAGCIIEQFDQHRGLAKQRIPPMSPDERAIRDLVALWMSTSKVGDYETMAGLMSEDVVFMVPGREPFGKAAFMAAARGARASGNEVDGTSKIQEIEVIGDWAWLRNRLEVTVRQPSGAVMRQAGYTLTILRKGADGRWRLVRDANLMAAQ
jgi:uncharacterized protein (TIGR02246 family)